MPFWIFLALLPKNHKNPQRRAYVRVFPCQGTIQIWSFFGAERPNINQIR